MGCPIKKILVYVDGTEQSVTAAQFALCFAKNLDAELSVLYVINTRALDDLLKARIFLKEEQLEYNRDLEADAERYLNYVRELARNKGIAAETLKVTGTPNQEIVRVVKEGRFDLLVIGELSRIRSRRDEFYDETERAMRSVPCSVLVVKDEERVGNMYESL